MAEQFKIGDFVRLKSGGPSMTVTSLDCYGLGVIEVSCFWFDDKQHEHKTTLPADVLEAP